MYILKHKKWGTYYCFDEKRKYKFYSVEGEKAYRFNRESSAKRILNKFKHAENWLIVEVKK